MTKHYALALLLALSARESAGDKPGETEKDYSDYASARLETMPDANVFKLQAQVVW